MSMPNFVGIMGLMPVSIILTTIFFILFAVSKTEQKWLKKFGYFVSAFLCFCALGIILTGIYILANVRPMMNRNMNMRMAPSGQQAK